MAFQTEFEFELPRGYQDAEGVLQKKGVMRLANAKDEILPLRDPRVQQNPGYMSLLLLAQVITRLGTLEQVDVRVLESLYTADLFYLQDLYHRINTMEVPGYRITCPHCGKEIELPVDFMKR